MNDDLETLLRAPLPEVADNGFSAKVLARIEAAQQRETAIAAAAIGASVLTAAAVLPVDAMLHVLVPAITQLVLQPALYIAAAAIGLSLMAEREFAQR